MDDVHELYGFIDEFDFTEEYEELFADIDIMDEEIVPQFPEDRYGERPNPLMEDDVKFKKNYCFRKDSICRLAEILFPSNQQRNQRGRPFDNVQV